MPELTSLCPAAATPDYHGGGLLNLMQTLSLELGGPDLGHAPLSGNALAGIGRHRHVCLILIDGLGDAQLQHLGADSQLRRHQIATISSVLPPTTTAAVSTVLTGQPPAVHGLLGWHMLHNGEIIAPLPLYVRHPRPGQGTAQQRADSLYVAPPLFERFTRPATLWLPEDICHSPCSRHHAGSAMRRPYADADDKANGADAFAQLARQLAAPEPSFQYLYLRKLDERMHDWGPQSPPARHLLRELDAGFARLQEAAAQNDAALIVIADHGFVAAPAEQWLDLDAHVELYGMLAQPLSGETRLAFCHLKEGMQERFIARAQQEIGHGFWVIASEQLLAMQAFGPGAPHPKLAERCGDVTLVAKPGWNVRDTLPGEELLQMAGMHAGVHPDEMAIPLIVFRPQQSSA